MFSDIFIDSFVAGDIRYLCSKILHELKALFKTGNYISDPKDLSVVLFKNKFLECINENNWMIPICEFLQIGKSF